MKFMEQIFKEVLTGAVGNLQKSYLQKVKPAEKFSQDFKDGFFSAIETLKLIKKEMIERAKKIDEEEEGP